MGLFKPAWMSKKKEKALTAVSKLTSQSELARVAWEASLAEVRDSAIDRLTDQVLLADIANNANDAYARAHAVRQLSDQNMIEFFANNDRENYVRSVAIEKTTKYDILVALIEKHLPLFEGFTTADYKDSSAADALEQIMSLDFTLDEKKNALDMFLNNRYLFSVIKVCVPKNLYSAFGITQKTSTTMLSEGHTYDHTVFFYNGKSGA